MNWSNRRRVGSRIRGDASLENKSSSEESFSKVEGGGGGAGEEAGAGIIGAKE